MPNKLSGPSHCPTDSEIWHHLRLANPISLSAVTQFMQLLLIIIDRSKCLDFLVQNG
jgi:hypothetical protein